ncbi:hypothetical protein IV102_06335 [bacterium]|nr:hypothetical protein [bacterium]
MSRHRRRQGVFIISVLFIAVLVTMFVGAAFQLAPGALRRNVNESELALAHRAARSGIAYALARIKADPQWRGNDNGTVVNEPDLIVVEKDGNVIGLLKQGGLAAQFRIRFNYQDGPGGGDGLADPTGLEIQVPLVSFNNLLGNSAKPVPKADGSGFSVPATPVTHTTLQPHTVYLVCEGRCGDWLRNASDTNPNPAEPTFGSVTRARIETAYKVTNLGQPVTAAVAASASSFITQIGPDVIGENNSLILDSSVSSVMGRLRSRDDMTVQGGDTDNLTAPQSGERRVRATKTFSGAASTTVTAQTELESDGLYSIQWSDVHQAAPGPSNQIQAGVYTVWQDGTLHYYDMDLASYRTHITANPNDAGVVPAPLPSTVSYSVTGPSTPGMQAEFTISGDTAVNTSVGAHKDLVIIPKKGAEAGEGAPGGGTVAESSVFSGMTTSQGGGQPVNWDGSKFEYNSGMSTFLDLVAQQYNPVYPSDWNLGSSTTMANLGSSTLTIERPSSNQSNTASKIDTLLMGHVMNYINANPTDPAVLAALAELSVTIGGGGELSEVPLPDTTVPQNLLMKFDPAGSSSAALSGAGNVTLGARVEGEGGSITAQGDINMVGLGVALAASTNPKEGVSLYSQGDILISTYDKLADAYHDVALKGVAYCWGDFKALLGKGSLGDGTKWGRLNLTGALVAYGKDPSDTVNPATLGHVDIKARSAELKFDSSYLLSIMSAMPGGVELGRVWWMQQ